MCWSASGGGQGADPGSNHTNNKNNNNHSIKPGSSSSRPYHSQVQHHSSQDSSRGLLMKEGEQERDMRNLCTVNANSNDKPHQNSSSPIFATTTAISKLVASKSSSSFLKTSTTSSRVLKAAAGDCGGIRCRWVQQHGRTMSHSSSTASATSPATTTSTSTSSSSSSSSLPSASAAGAGAGAASKAAGCVRGTTSSSCCSTTTSTTTSTGGWGWNPRGLFMWPLSLQVLLLTLCYCRHVSSDDQLNLIHARLVNMLKTKQSLFYRRHLRADNSGMDLREHRVFHSDPKLDCCPTLTEFEPRRTGINPSGLVLELFSSKNFTQSFYETICHPSLRNRPCQFIDPRISYATRCVQQFSYVYAIGRTYGSNEGFRVDYIRIPAGCKCQVRSNLLRRRKKSVLPAVERQ